MLIGELSKRCGLSRDTIRFYEKHGLISVGRKERRYNNYKEYSDETLQRLMAVRRIKNFGFTLNETSELLEMIDANEATCAAVAGKVEEKINLVDVKIKELLALRAQLIAGVSNCKGMTCEGITSIENCSFVLGESG